MSGTDLKALRVSRSLTIDAAARRVGVARMTWWRWENEQRAISPVAEIAIRAKVGRLKAVTVSAPPRPPAGTHWAACTEGSLELTADPTPTETVTVKTKGASE